VNTPETTATNRRGAPRGNRNALRIGTHSLTLGRLPTGGSYIARLSRALRKQLESEIVKRDGATTCYTSALIQSACRHETRALLLQRWLRVGGEIPLMQRLSILEAIGRASTARDTCLQKLGLDRKADDPLNVLRRFSSDTDLAEVAAIQQARAAKCKPTGLTPDNLDHLDGDEP